MKGSNDGDAALVAVTVQNALNQAFDDVDAAGVFEIQRDAELVAIHPVEIR